METKLKSIVEFAKGGIMERVDYEMSKVIENILDINTHATKKRVLNLKIELTPDSDRQMVTIQSTVSSKLQPTAPVSTALYIDGETAFEMVPNIPGQINITGNEQPQPAQLKLLKNA